MASNTSHAVRLEKKIIDRIRPIAAANRRTVKGQIETFLNAAIREAAGKKS